MRMKYMTRVVALLLIAVTLSVFSGCSAARAVRPGARANKVVATAGELEITYDTLYYITMTRTAELKRTYGEDVLQDPAVQEELKAFVTEHLLTRSEALISLGLDYGLSVDKGEIAESVQADMEQIITAEKPFNGDRKAYIDSLNAEYLTDRYIRTYLAVEDHLPVALVNEMLQRGDLDDSDATARERINGEDFIRTVHVFIDKNDLFYTAEEDRAHAHALQTSIAAMENADDRYAAMRRAIGGEYNTDFGDTTGNGYYMARGEFERAYEEAAFALPEYGVSNVVETNEGFYVIMRLPKDAAYIEKNFQTLKEKTYYVELNQKVDERLASLSLEMTSYGRSLDLLDLPPIDADGGEVPFVIGVVSGCVVCVGAVAVIVAMLLRKRKKDGKKRTKVRAN